MLRKFGRTLAGVSLNGRSLLPGIARTRMARTISDAAGEVPISLAGGARHHLYRFYPFCFFTAPAVADIA